MAAADALVQLRVLAKLLGGEALVEQGIEATGLTVNVEDSRMLRDPRMSGPEFRAFQEGRPDHERWELIEGVPVMMTPPLMEHNVIATNLQNLLNAALREHDETRYAAQRPGIEFPWPTPILAEMEKNGDYKSEPDVAVVD